MVKTIMADKITSKSQSKYTAEAIEVLSGLEPVRRRPGMYTDTTNPNHLAHEVIDNSVDEALEGFAKRIDVIYHKDHSLKLLIMVAACRLIFIRKKKCPAWN